MATKTKEVVEQEFPKVFVTEDGKHELIARDEVMEAAFKKQGLKEKAE